MDNYIVWILIGVAVIAVRVVMHFVDKNQIMDSAMGHGWTNIEVRWDPFAAGWFFEKGERHYSVTFIDQAGEPQTKICKTSLFGGVYWRDTNY